MTPLTIDVVFDVGLNQYVAEDVIDGGDSIRGYGLTEKTALLNFAAQMPNAPREAPDPEFYHVIAQDGRVWAMDPYSGRWDYVHNGVVAFDHEGDNSLYSYGVYDVEHGLAFLP